jgi:hypothetical protein
MLRSSVDDRDELGLLVGYAVLHGLASYQTQSKSAEEVRFGQVKAVYQGLRTVMDEVEKSGGHALLCDLATKVDPLIRSDPKVLPPPEVPQEKKGYLFFTARAYISHRRGSNEDILRRRGLALVDSVLKEGNIQGNPKRTMTNDFKQLASLFGQEGAALVCIGGGK